MSRPFDVLINIPESGYSASFVELEYNVEGLKFTVTTEVSIAGSNPITSGDL